MKTNLHILTNLLSLVISVVILIGCAKEKTEKQAPLIQATESESLVNKVLNFSQMATDLKEGKILKNTEKMPIDTALYYISATLNYKYCYHTANYDKLNMDTITIKVPILGLEEKALLVDALAGYNDAVTEAKAKYMKIDGLTKKLINIVFLNAEINQGIDTVKISLGLQIGIGNGQLIESNVFFNQNEQFWWTRDSQNCNGDDTYGGAPNVLVQYLLFKYKQAPPANCRYWFPYTEEETFIATQYPGDLTPDFFCDYKIFYASGLSDNVLTGTVQCLGLEEGHGEIHEMDYYLDGMDSILSSFLTNTGKSVAVIDIYSITDRDPLYPTLITIKHSPVLTYGFKKIICWEVPNNVYPISIE